MDKIPFTIEQFEKGLKPVYRNGQIPEHIHNHAGSTVSWTKEGWVIVHGLDGTCSLAESYDLFLLPEEETLWIAIDKTKNEDATDYFVSRAYPSKDELSKIGFNEFTHTIISHTRTKQ